MAAVVALRAARQRLKVAAAREWPVLVALVRQALARREPMVARSAALMPVATIRVLAAVAAAVVQPLAHRLVAAALRYGAGQAAALAAARRLRHPIRLAAALTHSAIRERLCPGVALPPAPALRDIPA
jgi:hypothetical protein